MERTTPKRPLFVVFATVLINSIGFGIILPVMPQLVMAISGEGLAEAAIYGGWLLFCYAMMQFVFSPVLGNLSDAFGRRSVLLLSLLAFSLDYVVMAFAPTLVWLFAGRIVAGAAASTNTIANAYIADISPSEERPQNFGLLGAAFGVGFIVGPVIGGFLGEYGYRTPFLAAAGLAFANFVFAFFVLKESLPKPERRPFELARSNPLGAVNHFMGNQLLIGLISVVFIYSLGHFVLPATWAYFTMEKFAWSPREIGYSLSFVGTLMVLTQGLLTRVIIPKIGAPRAATVGMLLSLVSYLGYGIAPYGWVLYVAMVPGALAGLTMPALQGIMTDQVSQRSQGELQGAVASAHGLTAVIGPPLMTGIFSFFTRSDAWYYYPGAAFFAAALLTVSAVILFRYFLGHVDEADSLAVADD